MGSTTLSELFKLNPDHREAQHLRDKIAACYSPQTFTNSIGMKLIELKPG